MIKLENRKEINMLVFVLTMTYTVSYITRINFGAIISEMERETQIGRSLLSMALTGSFITYGTGQVISGILGDRFSPKKLVSFGLLLTVLMNICIPFCKNAYLMCAVWCVNGFAQSFMWPPLVRIMTELLTEDDYKDATVKVSWGSSFGTIFIYLVSPVVISLFSWRAVFFLSALSGALMLILWNFTITEIEPGRKQIVCQRDNKPKNMIFTPVMISIMVVVVLQGMLRDGVTTWMPSYISETYNLSNVVSILTGVILPLFSILSFQIALRLYRKVFTNPIMCAGMFFLLGAVASIALYLFSDFNATLSVLLSALLTGCMHGVNFILIGMIPMFFVKYGNVSTVSGIVNSCTYIGSATSTYAIALLSEKFGWSFTLFFWSFVAILGTLISFLNVKPWDKNYQHTD